MACLLAVLVVAFPRIAIVLLYFFTNFFSGIYHSFLIPILGFVFLPLTLIAYTYLLDAHMPVNSVSSLVVLFIAIILDLGLVGGATRRGGGRGKSSTRSQGARLYGADQRTPARAASGVPECVE